MQERYLGDSHDYAKYALLRHFSRRLDVAIGVNWYLTDGAKVDKPSNKDGEKRHHFAAKPWIGWEDDLLGRLVHLQDRDARRLGRFYQLGVLPQRTAYFDEEVSVADRAAWHRAARNKLKTSDLVFIDPDNGFEVRSMTVRTRPKYAHYHEALDYRTDGKIVVAIQFARQCDPIKRANDVRQRLSDLAGRGINTPVIRARLAPNLLFLTMAPAGLERDVAGCIVAFAKDREKIELIP